MGMVWNGLGWGRLDCVGMGCNGLELVGMSRN